MRRTPIAAQAAIEMMIAVVASMVLIGASLRIWLWMAQSITERQVAYEQTRRDAGRVAKAGCPHGYYVTGKLSVFGEANVPGQQLPCQ